MTYAFSGPVTLTPIAECLTVEMDDFGLSLPRIEPRSTTREAKSNAAVFELVVLCKLDDVCNICRDGIRLEHTLLPYMTIVLHNDDISYIKNTIQ